MSLYDKVIELSKRRGFLWPSFEIYGGTSGFITYGPYGKILKNNIENLWRNTFIYSQKFVEIESPIIMPKSTFEASGHLEHFTDPIVDCLKCEKRYRADHLIEEITGEVVEDLSIKELDKIVQQKKLKCPECGGNLGTVDTFNLMFKTMIGAYKGDIGYARPEAAQGMFVEFKRVFNIMREQLPLGIAQIGKTLRNEISPRKGVTRLREFTIMEVEVLLDPEKLDDCPNFEKYEDNEITLFTAELQEKKGKPIKISLKKALDTKLILNKWIAYFMGISKKFITDLGIPEDKQMFREQLSHERAHYSKQTIDLQVLLSGQGWAEMAGHAYRTDWDLSRHIKFSGIDMRVFKKFDKPKKTKILTVIPNKSLIGPEFKKDASDILSKLSSMDATDVKEKLKTKGFVEILGHKIGSKYITFGDKDETISGEKFIPHVIEPSYGADRLVYATLEHAYSEKDGRVILKLPMNLAPIQVMVYPLIEKDGLPELANTISDSLLDKGFRVDSDHSGSIGRRYARADEIGVPIGITVDYQSLEDNTITIRDRDTWKQRRCEIIKIPKLLKDYFKNKINFESIGKPIN